jgi:ABC-type nickel/cobalt efflux system permease component RcnA
VSAALRDQLPPPPAAATPNEITAKGTAVLNGITTVVVPCPQITANSLIFTSIMAGSGTLGVIQVVSRNPGVSFSVSSVALAASTIAWMVIEP